VNVADVRWRTLNCVLGFNVMGVWPRDSDGTDINALDVSREKGLVATANDVNGTVTCYPDRILVFIVLSFFFRTGSTSPLSMCGPTCTGQRVLGTLFACHVCALFARW
jgi:hypothetical protein